MTAFSKQFSVRTRDNAVAYAETTPILPSKTDGAWRQCALDAIRGLRNDRAMRIDGTFETCRPAWELSAYRGRPEVIGVPSELHD